MFDSQGAMLHIRAIQFQQHSLPIPLPDIPGSPLRPVAALQSNLRFNSGGLTFPYSQLHLPRLSVYSYHVSSFFFSFLSTTVSVIVLVPVHYSLYSFRRGAASFAFKCNVPAQLIHRQRDWESDGSLFSRYLQNKSSSRSLLCMANDILRLSSV